MAVPPRRGPGVGWAVHASGFIAIGAGLFLLADALRRGGFVPKRWWGALLLGAGGFQLYDGIVQHKLLGLHQIRYHVTLWPYDLTWNLIAAVMIAAGAALMTGRAAWRDRRCSAPTPGRLRECACSNSCPSR